MDRSKRETVLLFGAVLLAGAVILILAQQRLNSARNAFVSTKARYYQTQRQARTFMAGSGQDADVITERPRNDDISTRIQRVLRKAELPADKVASVTPTNPRRVPGTDYERQQYRAVLQEIDIGFTAKFLQVWALDQPQWKVSDIRLNANRRTNQFDLTVLFECVYLAETQASPRGSRP